MCRCLKERNLKVRDELIIDLTYTTFEEAKEAMERFIKAGITFDGVFATNDWLALGALIALRENNISVPQDVKIIGFDNISISKYSYPSITTIDQDKKKLGQEAANALLNFINKEETRAKLDIVIPVTLVERETT
ncbi:substrate-binding domain-containing protein [Bacillus sp. N9]